MEGVNLSAGNFAPSGKAKDFIYIAVLLVVVFIAYKVYKTMTGAADSALEAMHLKDSAETTAANKAIAAAATAAATKGAASPFSPRFYQLAPKGAKLFTKAGAQKIAKQIYDAIGIIYDSPENITGAIKQCFTQSQVSFLADTFNQLYSKDLLSYLTEKLDTAEQKQTLSDIITYVNELPKYKAA